MIVGAAALPAVKEKSFSDRVTSYATSGRPQKQGPLTKPSANPKAQPKSAVDRKVKVKPNVKGPKAAANAKPKKTQNAKPRAKTAEELDAEMTDYFNNNNAGTAAANAAAATNGAAEPAAAGGDDLGMEEISVGLIDSSDTSVIYKFPVNDSSCSRLRHRKRHLST